MPGCMPRLDQIVRDDSLPHRGASSGPPLAVWNTANDGAPPIRTIRAKAAKPRMDAAMTPALGILRNRTLKGNAGNYNICGFPNWGVAFSHYPGLTRAIHNRNEELSICCNHCLQHVDRQKTSKLCNHFLQSPVKQMKFLQSLCPTRRQTDVKLVQACVAELRQKKTHV